MKKFLVWIIAILIVVSSFMLTGCANDNNTTTTTKKPEPEKVTITKTVTSYDVDTTTFEVGKKIEREITYKGVIEIGNTNAKGPNYLQTSEAYNYGLKSYINMINFNGGIGGDYEKGEQGYYIEFIEYDDMNYGEYGLEYTKKLVEEDRVFAIVGQFSEYTVDATLDYIKNTGTFFVGPASGNAEMFNTEAYTSQEGATIFPVRPINTVAGRYIVKSICEMYPDYKKIGIIFSDDGEGAGIRDGVKAQLEMHNESDSCVVIEAEYGEFDADKLQDCDVIVVASGRTNAKKIFKTLADEKNSKPVFATDNISRTELSGADQFPIYLTNWFDTADLEGWAEFAYDVIQYFGDIKYLDNRYAMEGWIVADVFCEGLSRAVKAGVNFNNERLAEKGFINAMESEDITIKITSTLDGDSVVESEVYYVDGIRIGTVYLGLMNTNYEQVIALKDITPRMQ